MKKNYWLIILSLLISLCIYVFYRTERTLINEMIIWHVPYENFYALRSNISFALPLDERIVYSLPEGLWVFCVTLTSKPFFLKMGKLQIDLLYLPLIFSIGLELFQLLHLTNGRFDFWDIGVSVLFWGMGNFLMKHHSTRQNIFHPFTINSFICILSYLIVYLAHSWRWMFDN